MAESELLTTAAWARGVRVVFGQAARWGGGVSLEPSGELSRVSRDTPLHKEINERTDAVSFGWPRPRLSALVNDSLVKPDECSAEDLLREAFRSQRELPALGEC